MALKTQRDAMLLQATEVQGAERQQILEEVTKVNAAFVAAGLAAREHEQRPAAFLVIASAYGAEQHLDADDWEAMGVPPAVVAGLGAPRRGSA